MLDTFFVIIVPILAVLLIASIILLITFNRKKKQLEEEIEAAKQQVKTVVAEGDLFLKISDGNVEVVEAPVATVAAAVERVEEPSEEVQPAQPAAEGSELVAIDEDSVVFQATGKESKTFADKYEMLSEEARKMYDELSQYILATPKSKVSRSSSAETFKVGTDKVLRAVIRREVVVLNFMLANSSLNRFVKEEGIKNIKINPVVVRLETAEDLALAKQTVDLTIENIKQEQLYRKLRKKELREAKKAAEQAEQEQQA